MFGACFEAVQRSMLASSRKCSESVESWGSCNGSNRNLENEMGMDLKIQHLWLLLCLEMVCTHQRHWWGRGSGRTLLLWNTIGALWVIHPGQGVELEEGVKQVLLVTMLSNLVFRESPWILYWYVYFGMLMNNSWGWTGRKMGAASWFGPHSSFSLTFSTAFRFGMISTALRAECCSAAVLGLLLAQLIWPRRCPRSCHRTQCGL